MSQILTAEQAQDHALASLQQRPRWQRQSGIILAQVIVLLGVLLLWQHAHDRAWGNPILISSPADVWKFLVTAAGNGTLAHNLWATMQATLIAFVLGSLAGVAAGIVLGLSPMLSNVCAPFINALNSMPRIALAPLFIIIFGIETSAKVALAVTLVFFILLESAYAGIQSVDDDFVCLSEVLGANKWQRFQMVLLPFAVPSIFAGLRLGLTYSLLGVVSSEIIAAKNGLGQLVAFYSGTFAMAGVYGALIVMGGVAAVLNLGMHFLEKRLLSWKAQ